MGSQQASDEVNIPSSWGAGSNRIAAVGGEGNTPPSITAGNNADKQFDQDPDHQVSFFLHHALIILVLYMLLHQAFLLVLATRVMIPVYIYIYMSNSIDFFFPLR
jgi:hypothetical protein